MPTKSALNPERRLHAVSLIDAPSLFVISTFFWTRVEGRVEYGATGGTLIAIATVFWIPAFIGLFELVKTHMPRYAAWGLLAAIYGCVGGAAFGLEGLFAEAFKISHDVRREAWARFPTTFNLTFVWPGPLFPLSLLILGAMLIRTKSIPPWAGLLVCISAVAFPLSRIPRIEILAHGADVLMLIPLAYIAFRFFSDRDLSAGGKRGQRQELA